MLFSWSYHQSMALFATTGRVVAMPDTMGDHQHSSRTCLLSVKYPGQYMCTVDREGDATHLFTVALSGMCAYNSFAFESVLYTYCTICRKQE